MKSDEPPAGPGNRHPLDRFASPPVRDAVVRLLRTRENAVLTAWHDELARFSGYGRTSTVAILLPKALNAYIDLLHAGTTEAMNALAGDAGPADGSTLTPADLAARLHQALGSLPLAVFPLLLEVFPGDPVGQHEALALLLGATDLAVVCVYKALERSVTYEVQAVQDRQRRFYQEITRLATNDCLRLVEPHEIPVPRGTPLPIREPRDGTYLRREAMAVAHQAAMESTRAEDLALAVGEAVSNVLKHAGQGMAHVWREEHTVYVYVSDSGRGITLENLPKALTPGWSSEPSLGMGFTLMLEMADTVWLSTGVHGTTLCLEKSTVPRPEPIVEMLLGEDVC